MDNKTIIITESRNGLDHIVVIPASTPSYKVVERFQRNLRKLGCSDAISWKVANGGIVHALIATTL